MLRCVLGRGRAPSDRAATEMALGTTVTGPTADGSVPNSGLGLHRAPVEERMAHLDEVNVVLDDLLGLLGDGLVLATMDNVIGGVEDASEGELCSSHWWHRRPAGSSKPPRRRRWRRTVARSRSSRCGSAT